LKYFVVFHSWPLRMYLQPDISKYSFLAASFHSGLKHV